MVFGINYKITKKASQETCNTQLAFNKYFPRNRIPIYVTSYHENKNVDHKNYRWNENALLLKMIMRKYNWITREGN